VTAAVGCKVKGGSEGVGGTVLLLVGLAEIATDGAAVVGATVVGKAVGKAVVGGGVTCKVGAKVWSNSQTAHAYRRTQCMRSVNYVCVQGLSVSLCT
jgi:hypothetical protein